MQICLEHLDDTDLVWRTITLDSPALVTFAMRFMGCGLCCPHFGPTLYVDAPVPVLWHHFGANEAWCDACRPAGFLDLGSPDCDLCRAEVWGDASRWSCGSITS